MKYLNKQNNLLKKRSALKTIGLLSIGPALSGLYISSIKGVKEVYNNFPVKSNKNTEELQYNIVAE